MEHTLDTFLPSVSRPILDETVGERHVFYRLGESEMFIYANKNTTINGSKLIDILPRMTLKDQGFIHVDYNMLDKNVQYELFESSRFKIEGRSKVKTLLENGSVVMVYSDKYSIPVAIPYIVQTSGRNCTIYVNISDFVTMDSYGKFKVELVRNYNALMAVLFAAACSYEIVKKGATIPADIGDVIVLMYANMFERVVNSIAHMDPITRDKVRYLAVKFALIQMYGTEKGEQMFYRYHRSYFPKLTKMVTDSIDDQFVLDNFDNLTSFVTGLSSMYSSMRGLNTYMIYDKWIKSYGAATAMSIDYFGYYLYVICMVLFESPLISRMAIEPIMEKTRGVDLYKKLPMLITSL